MNYNWGDPKKNSKLTAIMMTKAEASRKKRLSSVKSTLSNQLHPSTESKLRKKKQSPESARDDSRELDVGDSARTASNNNNHHHHHIGVADDNDLKLKLAGGNDSFQGPEDSPASSSTTTPIFGEFGLHAAADGLFHPASTIAAFIEHDAKYNSAPQSSKPTSGRSSLSSRSGSRASTVGEYLPSLATQKLPVVLNAPSRHTKRSAGAAAATLTPLDAATRHPAIAATRSDSDLHAPRKVGAVPSSADRNALDLYAHDDDDDDGDDSGYGTDNDGSDAVVRAKSSPPDLSTFALASNVGANKLGSSKSATALSATGGHAPPHVDDQSLVKKFEDLKLLMSAKKMSKVVVATVKPQTKSRKSSVPVDKSAVSSSSSQISSSSNDGHTRIAKAATATPVVVKTPPVIRSKTDVKIRNGVSLSDLKAEHRAALEMLQALGGPMDVDYDRVEPDERIGPVAGAARSKPTATRITLSSKASSSVQPVRVSQKPPPPPSLPSASSSFVERHETRNSMTTSSVAAASASPRDEPETPSPVTHAGGGLVTKLRASIPSGRARTPELANDAADSLLMGMSTSDTIEPVELLSTAVVSRSANPTELVASSEASFVLRSVDRPLEHVDEVDEEESDDAENDSRSSRSGTDDQTDDARDARADDSDVHWTQYENDADSDGADEDDEVDDLVDGDSSRSAPVTARSVDLYGDDGFESEW